MTTSRDSKLTPHARAEKAFLELAEYFGPDRAKKMMLAIMLKHGIDDVLDRANILALRNAYEAIRTYSTIKKGQTQ